MDALCVALTDYQHLDGTYAVAFGFSLGADAVLALDQNARFAGGRGKYELVVSVGARVGKSNVSKVEKIATIAKAVVIGQIKGDTNLANDGWMSIAGDFFGDRSYEAAVNAIVAKYGSMKAFYKANPNVVIVPLSGTHAGAGNRTETSKKVLEGIDALNERDAPQSNFRDDQ